MMIINHRIARHLNRTVLVIVGFSLLLPIQSSEATLIIAIYNNNAFYVCSDSLVSQQDSNHFNAKKIFEVSKTCCVSIANNYGGPVRDAGTGHISLLFLPNELDKECAEFSHSPEPLQSVITNITARFKSKYDDYMSRKLPNGTTNQDFKTRLCFWGYDDLNQSFFGYSCLFNGTNHNDLESVFERGAKNTAGPLWFQGEDSFLPGLIMSQDKQLVALRTIEFNEGIQAIRAELPLADDRVVKSILEMFRLHKQYAPIYSSEKGWIGEPYVIYKITKEKIVQIR
jgi:hypothetical protein